MPVRTRRKDQASRRDQDLVRQLVGRVLWSRGELCQVRGDPDLERLVIGVARLYRGTLAMEDLTAEDLGWRSSAVQVVSRRGLESRARALTRRRRVVQHRGKGRSRGADPEAELLAAAGRGLADRRRWLAAGPGRGLCFPGDQAPRGSAARPAEVRALGLVAAWLGEPARGEVLAQRLHDAATSFEELGVATIPAAAAAFWAAILGLGTRAEPPGLRGLDPGTWGRMNRRQRLGVARALLESRETRGGRRLVAWLEWLPRLPVAWEVESLARLLDEGLERDELVWVVSRALGRGRDFEDHPEPARAARVLRRVDALLCRLLPPDDDSRDRSVGALYDALEQPGVVSALEAFLDWVATLPLPQLDTVGRRHLAATLRTLAVAGGRGPRLVSLLRRWARPPRRLPAHPDEARVREEETLRELRRLGLYQRWAGEEPRLPTPVIRRLETGSRRARERAALEAREAEGRLSDGARARLAHLRSTPEGGRDEGWVRRRLREARARVGLAGLRAAIRDTVARGWQQLFGQPPPDLGEARLLELLSWADGLKGKDRRRLEELVSAWRVHGPRYREALPENRSWLAAPPGGLDAAAWCRPPRRRFTLSDGRGGTVEVASDPFRVLLMGSLFDTCLALGGGFNRRSVLANAREINKAVLFWTRSDGAILGRKLVGVNARGQVVGFHAYLALAAEDPDRHRLAAAGTELVEAWAQAAGSRLAGDGTPPVLGGAFWYDDGLVAWPRPEDPADREELWRSERPAIEALAASAELPSPPEDASATLRRDWLLEVARERRSLPGPPWPAPGEVGEHAPDRALVVATELALGEPPRGPHRQEGGRLELLPVLGEGPRARAWRRAALEHGELRLLLAHGDVPGDPARTAARLRPVAEDLGGGDWLPGDAAQWRWLARLAYEEDGRGLPGGFVSAMLRLADPASRQGEEVLLALATVPASKRGGGGLARRDRVRLERSALAGAREAARRLAGAALLAPSRGLDATLARVAEVHPEALLALALRRGSAARPAVERGVARWPERVAALLAWRVVTGEDAVFERHRQAPGAAPTRGRACAAAQLLYRRFSAGAPRLPEEALHGLDDWERREALPLLVDAWDRGRYDWPEVSGDPWTLVSGLPGVLVAAQAGRAPEVETRAWVARARSLSATELLLASRRAGGATVHSALEGCHLQRGDLALVGDLALQGLSSPNRLRVSTVRDGWELPPRQLAAALGVVRHLPGVDWESDRPASGLGRAVLDAVLSAEA